MADPLEAILKYEMPEDQAKAYKLCLIWEDLIRKDFPGYRTTMLPKRGDPRKGLLFRHCLKLLQDIKLPDEHYKLYLGAQLQILKLQTDGKVHAMIEPHILTGPQAWKRWKVWEKHFLKSSNQIGVTFDPSEITASEAKVIADLDKTKSFLLTQYKQLPTVEQLKKNLADRALIRWVTLGKVTAYYALLSPNLRKALDGKTMEDVFMFDLTSYRHSLSDNIKQYFRKEFAGEFE